MLSDEFLNIELIYPTVLKYINLIDTCSRGWIALQKIQAITQELFYYYQILSK